MEIQISFPKSEKKKMNLNYFKDTFLKNINY